MLTEAAFIAAVHGTTLQPDGSLLTSDASGQRLLRVVILNERWFTSGGEGFGMTQNAFDVLSAEGAEQHAGGTSVKVGTTIYSVILNQSGMVDVQQASA